MRVAVASGKGGTGKTTIAVNLAVAAARAGHRVQLLDCDVEEPNAHLFLRPRLDPPRPVSLPVPVLDPSRCQHCGQCAEICAFNAIACLPGHTLIFEELCHGCAGCWQVCPQQALMPGERILGEVATGLAGPLRFTGGRLRVGETVVPPLIRAVRETTDDEAWVFLDAPPGTTCPVVQTLRGVDYAVLVTEPTPFGEHDLALALELARTLGLPSGVVVNRDEGGDDRIDRLCAREGVEILARIPFSREVAKACAEGAMAIDVSVEAAEAVRALLHSLQARTVTA